MLKSWVIRFIKGVMSKKTFVEVKIKEEDSSDKDPVSATSLSQINIRIIPYVQHPGFAGNTGIAADDG